MLKENFSLIKNMFLYLRSDFYQLFTLKLIFIQINIETAESLVCLNQIKCFFTTF